MGLLRESIKGSWVQIEIKDIENNIKTAYVFDGYLNNELVNINIETNVANGEWRWYYTNGQLGELGSYLKDIQIGLWNVNEKRQLPILNWNFKE